MVDLPADFELLNLSLFGPELLQMIFFKLGINDL